MMLRVTRGDSASRIHSSVSCKPARSFGNTSSRITSPRHSIFGVFQIRQVDVENAIQEPQHLDAVVGVRIVDEGQPQPALRSKPDGPDDLRGKMRRRNKSDVVAAFVLQLED